MHDDFHSFQSIKHLTTSLYFKNKKHSQNRDEFFLTQDISQTKTNITINRKHCKYKHSH